MDYTQWIGEAAAAILMPIGLWLLGKLFPVNENKASDFFPKNEQIENVVKIEHYSGDIAPNGETTKHSTRVVYFRNGEYWESGDNSADPTDKEIVQLIAQKQRLIIEEKGIRQ